MKKIIRLTESDLVRLVKRVINEEKDEESQNTLIDKNWSIIFNALKSFTDSSGNRPKIISYMNNRGLYPTYKKITSLSWGTGSEAGSKKNKWGISISSANEELEFVTKNDSSAKETAKKYEDLTGRKPYKGSESSEYRSDELPLDYSNPQEVISTVKKIIKGMGTG